MKRILILSLFICFSACRKTDQATGVKTLRYPLSGEISTLDPARSYDVVSGAVVYNVYETLFEYHYLKRPYTVMPNLAAEMPKVSTDKLTYTIKILKGVPYHTHPGFEGKKRFVKAQDFVLAIKRLVFAPTQSTGKWLLEGKVKGVERFAKLVGSDFEKMVSTPLEGVRALDDHTLQIKLDKPFPQILNALAMSFTAPTPIEVVRFLKNDLTQEAVGTGPFYLKKWNKRLNVVLERFPEYRHRTYPGKGDRKARQMGLLKDAGKRIPFLDRIDFKIMKETNTAWLNFQSQKLDALLLDKDEFSAAIDGTGQLGEDLKKMGVGLQVEPTLTYYWLSFNLKDKLMTNRNLRLAIAHAINRDRYIELFTNNVAQKSNSIMPPGVPGYRPSYKLPYEYDVAKAREYLKQAGFPEGKGLPVIQYDTRRANSTGRQMAEFFKSELKKIGIEIQINTNTFPAFLAKARKGDLQFWRGGWACDFPDAENVMQLLFSENTPPGPNTAYYSNAQYDSLYKKIAVMEDGDERFQLLREMEDKVQETVPWVMLYYSRNYVLIGPKVRNFRKSGIVNNFFKYVRVID